MSTPLKAIPYKTHTGHTLTPQEKAFITAFLVSKNASQSVKEAGYKSKAPEKYGNALLSRTYIREEIQYHLDLAESKKIASATEILQFYTSVMRGEVLDQFGIEASIDTRIKAANELAKHQIELPRRLQEKQLNNQVGSIQINFIPRRNSDEDIVEAEIVSEESV